MLRDNKLKKNQEKTNYNLSYNQPLEILFSINDDYIKLFRKHKYYFSCLVSFRNQRQTKII